MLQWLVNLSPLLNLVAVIALLYLIYEYRFPLRRRLERLDDSTNYLGRLLTGLLSLTGNLIAALHRRDALTEDEFRRIQQNYFDLVKAGIQANVARFITPENPLGREESERLRLYIAKAERGEPFSPEEVEDYQGLMTKLEREHQGDPGLWPLIALGAFLFGLYLGSRRSPAQRGGHP